MTDQTKYVRNAVVVEQGAAGLFALALDGVSCEAIHLDGTAATVFRVVNSTPVSLENIIEATGQQYGLDAKVVEGDVTEFIAVLKANRLIRCS